MSEPVSLRDYVDRRLADMDQHYNALFRLNETSVSKAERTMNERLNSMNEFRDALKDQANRMATRTEVEKVDQAVQDLQRAKANLDGRLVAFSAGVSILMTLLLHFAWK